MKTESHKQRRVKREKNKKTNLSDLRERERERERGKEQREEEKQANLTDSERERCGP